MDATIMIHHTPIPSLVHNKLMQTPGGVRLLVKEGCGIYGDTHGDDWNDKPLRPHEVDKFLHSYVHSFGKKLAVYFRGYKWLAIIMTRCVASLREI